MKFLLSVILLLSLASLCLAGKHNKPPKYINYVPYNGINCTGPVTGHGTSYLLDKCIPFEGYSLKYSLSNNTVLSYVYFNQNCSGSATGYPSALNTCYKFRNGYITNPFFYAYLSASRKAIKPPKGQLTLYMKSYDQSKTTCKGDFNWSKYVTNGTTWFLDESVTESLYCDENNQPIEEICEITPSITTCIFNSKYSDCDPFPQQLSNLVAKCKGPNPNYNPSGSDSDSDDEDDFKNLQQVRPAAPTQEYKINVKGTFYSPLTSIPKHK